MFWWRFWKIYQWDCAHFDFNRKTKLWISNLFKILELSETFLCPVFGAKMERIWTSFSISSKLGSSLCFKSVNFMQHRFNSPFCYRRKFGMFLITGRLEINISHICDTRHLSIQSKTSESYLNIRIENWMKIRNKTKQLKMINEIL